MLLTALKDAGLTVECLKRSALDTGPVLNAFVSGRISLTLVTLSFPDPRFFIFNFKSIFNIIHRYKQMFFTNARVCSHIAYIPLSCFYLVS